MFMRNVRFFVQVRGYFIIKMFFVGKKDGDVMEYDGGRIFLDIVNWVIEKFVENFFFSEVVQVYLQF